MDDACKELLRGYSNFHPFPGDHSAFLYKLRDEGRQPKVIYDVGSSLLHWAQLALKIWPDARIICFDGVSDLEYLYKEKNFEFYPAVLSDSERRVRWYYLDDSPGGNSYYKQAGDIYADDQFVMRNTTTLDKLVEEKNLPLPDLIKLDVQGCELDIINGAPKCVGYCYDMIVEMQKVQYNEGAPLVRQTLPAIENKGFECVAPLFCDNGVDGDYYFARRITQ